MLQRRPLGGVAVVGLALDLLDHLERPRRAAAAAQTDEVLAAGQHLDRVGDEIAVAGDRHHHLPAEEILRLRPEAVVEHVGVGDDDDIDRLHRS